MFKIKSKIIYNYLEFKILNSEFKIITGILYCQHPPVATPVNTLILRPYWNFAYDVMAAILAKKFWQNFSKDMGTMSLSPDAEEINCISSMCNELCERANGRQYLFGRQWVRGGDFSLDKWCWYVLHVCSWTTVNFFPHKNFCYEWFVVKCYIKKKDREFMLMMKINVNFPLG